MGNGRRYSPFESLSKIPQILASFGMKPADIDRFVLDGWHGSGPHWRESPAVSLDGPEGSLAVPVASYNEASLSENTLLRRFSPGGLQLGDVNYSYASYLHVTGHILGAYCSSPYANAGEPAYVLVWDGGQYPRLYFVDPVKRKIENKGKLFFFLGTIYGIMGHYFGPYKRTDAQREAERQKQEMEGYFGGYSIAGKLMSYIALGELQKNLLQALPEIYRREFEFSNGFEHKYMRAVFAHVAGLGYSDADVLLAQHTYLEQLILTGLKEKIGKDGLPPQNFCFTGGAALNIKWNSAIRKSGLFRAVWVPPFPNDAGSAIGAACCEMMSGGGPVALAWNVYSGPMIGSGAPDTGWQGRTCALEELASILALEGEPVVFLNSAAELGPRALGNRSILAPATRIDMKTILNRVKMRENFRPIAPVCMEEYAEDVFDPGTSDPYMLFDHHVRAEWRHRVPAICHLDGTARLQTVNLKENERLHRLLDAYRRLTGIPLLCNTSANFNGCGFFPDVASAMRWGGVNYIYCDETLYEKVDRIAFLGIVGQASILRK